MAFKFVHRALVLSGVLLRIPYGDGCAGNGRASVFAVADSTLALAVAQAVFFYGVAPSSELVSKNLFQLVRVQ
jgi:hypothetical protein